MTEARLCVVGAGNLATRRIYPYIAPAGARILAVCDLDLEAARTKTRLYGGEAFSDMEVMLDRCRPDGVIICTGPAGHAALAPKAMRRGVPVYTEKPPALNAADALELVRISRETGVPCITGFKKRYATANRRAREWISIFPESDRLSISADYASGLYSNQSEVSSLLLDFAIHLIDLIPHLFGPVARVFAFQKEGHAFAVSLLFQNGGVGALNFTDGRSFQVPTEEIEITLRGGNFMTIHNSSSWRITENGKPSEWREPPTFTSAGDSGGDTGHFTEIAAFVKAVMTNDFAGLPSKIEDSYQSMVLYDSILKSALIGQVVDVHDALLQ